MRLKEPEKAWHLLVLVLCLFAVTVSFLMQYDGSGLALSGIKWPLKCALFQTFGIKCALCGLTRSFCLMAKGDFRAAASFHPVGPAIFFFVILQIPYRIYALWFGTTKLVKLRRIGVYSAFGIAAALLANWIVYLGGRFL